MNRWYLLLLEQGFSEHALILETSPSLRLILLFSQHNIGITLERYQCEPNKVISKMLKHSWTPLSGSNREVFHSICTTWRFSSENHICLILSPFIEQKSLRQIYPLRPAECSLFPTFTTPCSPLLSSDPRLHGGLWASLPPPRPHPPPGTTTTGSADQWHLPVRAQLTLTVPRRLLALARLTATSWGIILFHLGHVGEGRSLGQGWHMATSHTAPPPPSPLLDLLLVSTGTSYAPGE